jgi:hypothetical protein
LRDERYLALTLAFFSMNTLAAPGYFSATKPQISDGPAVSIVSTVVVGGKKKPEIVIDGSGRRAHLDYHADGRLRTVTFPDQGGMVVIHYKGGKPDGGTVIDLATGEEVVSTVKKEKLLEFSQECGTGVDPDCAAKIEVTGSYNNPFASDYWGGSGPGYVSAQLAQEPPPNCSLGQCKTACSAGLSIAAISCGFEASWTG